MSGIYEFTYPETGRALVAFNETYVNNRYEDFYEEEFREVLARNEVLIVDVTKNEYIGSRWWKMLGRLGEKARREGRKVVIAGASVELRKTPDIIAVSPNLDWVKDINEVS